jgi:hypothetical protein
MAAMKKHLKWKGRSRRAEAGAKNEKVERELEGKLPPFSFFFVVFLCVLFSLCFRRKKQRQCTIVFFCGVTAKKVTIVSCHRLLLYV